MKKPVNVAIDGPSGAGKSTLARMAAKELGYLYVDTGAMYRTIALFVLRAGVEPHDEKRVGELLDFIELDMAYRDGEQRMLLNGEDVSDLIRTPEVTAAASAVSALGPVREFLLETQRELARRESILMDGRDIGTVVLPDAQVKIFLTAAPEERARRRLKDFEAKGVSITYEQVLADIIQRDYNDSHREIAPLRQAEDAILLDTSDYDLEESFNKLVAIIREAVSHG